MRVGLIGASGFVGGAIYKAFSTSDNHECISIIRGDDLDRKLIDVDFVVHAANSAKRFVANSNPVDDRNESLGKTNRILEASKGKPVLLISSISCRTQLDTPYGVNRFDCEREVLNYGGSIIRLGPMFGLARKVDVIHDICDNRKVFVARDTKYSFSDVDWNGMYIAQNFQDLSGVIEIGAQNSISLGEIAVYVESKSEFVGKNDDQFPLDFTSGPDVSAVFEFINKFLLTPGTFKP
jgi:nucleoside-diphosphate-sugar epimerase